MASIVSGQFNAGCPIGTETVSGSLKLNRIGADDIDDAGEAVETLFPFWRQIVVQKQKHVTVQRLQSGGEKDRRFLCQRTVGMDVGQEREIVKPPEKTVQFAQSTLVCAPYGKLQATSIDGASHETGISEAVGDVVMKIDLLHGINYG